jgi:hypothetical protein
MGSENLLTKLENGLRAEIGAIESHTLAVDLPTSVELLVISPFFQNMPRHERAEYLAAKTEEILGEQYYKGLYVVSGLTKAEYDSLKSDPENDLNRDAVSENLRPSAAPESVREG